VRNLERQIAAVLRKVARRVAEGSSPSKTLRIDDHHEIDFGPLLHDELSLTEPMHPLCRPDCPGLCSVCGAPLADGVHLHEADELDPRLAPLARLLDRGEN